MELTIGNIVEGKVIKITSFGAFVNLGNNTTGMIHISEIADSFVNDINDFISPQDIVKVKIISCDQSGKIGLSLKQAQPPKKSAPPPIIDKAERIINESFEDKLAKFMKESNDKQSSMKKHLESKKFR